MKILDIHTHHPAPQPEAVISVPASTPVGELADAQLYSAGIHPWDTAEMPGDELWNNLEELLRDPRVVAVGECGVDLAGKGAPLFRQLQIFRRQIELSEKYRKPILVHSVKTHDIIVGLRRDLAPSMPWVIHGFRNKPQPALQLIRSGCYISLGEKFNVETLRAIPADRLLAETDESPLTIQQIIEKLSESVETDLTDRIATNTAALLSL